MMQNHGDSKIPTKQLVNTSRCHGLTPEFKGDYIDLPF